MKNKCLLALTAFAVSLGAAEADLGLDPIRFEKGVHGQAAVINGLNTYLTDSSAVFPLEKGLSISMWVKPRKWSHLAGLLENVGSFSLVKRDKDYGGLYHWNRKGHHTVALLPWNPKAFPLPENKWSHIAFTYDQKGHGVGYLNGKIVGELFPDKNVQKKDIPVIDSGRRYNKGTFRIGMSYRGSLDDVYIYNRVLSQKDIQDLMKGNAPADPIAAYLMDDPSMPGKDSSASARHLKPACGPTGKPAPLLGYTVDVPVAAANDSLVAYCRKSVDRVFHNDKLKSVKVKDVVILHWTEASVCVMAVAFVMHDHTLSCHKHLTARESIIIQSLLYQGIYDCRHVFSVNSGSLCRGISQCVRLVCGVNIAKAGR